MRIALLSRAFFCPLSVSAGVKTLHFVCDKMIALPLFVSEPVK
jgi:hypothetical protein